MDTHRQPHLGAFYRGGTASTSAALPVKKLETWVTVAGGLAGPLGSSRAPFRGT